MEQVLLDEEVPAARVGKTSLALLFLGGFFCGLLGAFGVFANQLKTAERDGATFQQQLVGGENATSKCATKGQKCGNRTLFPKPCCEKLECDARPLIHPHSWGTCQPKGNVTCFAGDSHILTSSGEYKNLQSVAIGESIETSSGFEPLLGWLHFSPSSADDFLKIEHEHGVLRISPSHLVFLMDGNAVRADEIRVGDGLASKNGQSAVTVKSISPSQEVRTFVAPLLASGTIILDSIVASTYADVPHAVGQFVLGPIRALLSPFLSKTTSFAKPPAVRHISL